MPRFVSTGTPIERFLKYCRFDACSGCVVWIGGKTRGQGHHGWYGRFWDGKRSVLAHRWAAQHIHNLDISNPDEQVDHTCRNTLCVHHLQVISATRNRELQWVRIQVGLDKPPDMYEADPDAVPYYLEPEWLKNA